MTFLSLSKLANVGPEETPNMSCLPLGLSLVQSHAAHLRALGKHY